MFRSARYGALAALFVLAGCATTARAPATSNISQQDLEFITTVYQLVHFDLGACSFVRKSRAEPKVEKAIDTICADAAEDAPRIEQFAARNNVGLPDTLPLDFKAQLVSLTYHPEPNVAVEFLRTEISSHESALAVFEKEMRTGMNPEFKSVAERAVPVAEQNLAMLHAAMPDGMTE